MGKVVIAPSIIAADFAVLREELRRVDASGADVVHVDIMDGQFVPNLTIGELFVKMLVKESSLPLDLHFMVNNPEIVIPRFYEYGPNSITFHTEAAGSAEALIGDINQAGIKAGVSVKPATAVDVIKPYIEKLNNVLIMSVEPGFSGQSFQPAMLDKVRRALALRRDHRAAFEVWLDGGANLQTAAEIAAAGTEYIVMGSGFFKSGDYAETVRKVRGVFAS